MHAGHDPDVIVVEQVHFLKVKMSRQLSLVIGKEEFCDSLWDEGLGLIWNFVNDADLMAYYGISGNSHALLANSKRCSVLHNGDSPFLERGQLTHN
jgi:hypothetical protein